MSRTTRSIGALILCCLGLCSGKARAETVAPSAAERASKALRLGQQAMESYEAGDWRQCERQFSEADQTMHSPVFVLYAARCSRNLGAWRDALDRYEALATESETPEMPLSWRDARRAARAESDKLKAAIPYVHIAARGDGLKLVVDDVAETADQAIALEPGKHSLRVERAGALLERREFELTPSTHLWITVGPYDSAPSPVRSIRQVPRQSSSLPPPVTSRTRSQSLPLRKAGIAAAGMAGLALLGGGVLWALAEREDAKLERECDANQCERSLLVHAERGRSLANAATVAFGVAIAGASAGAVFFYISSSRPTNNPAPASADWQLAWRGKF